MNWATKFCLICCIHLTSRQLIHFFKHFDNFLHGKCFHNQQDVENAFQELIKSWSMGFCAKGINKTNLFLVDKNVLIIMVPILINKDVFEPSYNDLKFTAPNRNNVCTNLIVSVSVLGHFQLINFSAYYESCFPASLHIWWYLDTSHCKFCFIRCFLFFFYDSYWALVWDILVFGNSLILSNLALKICCVLCAWSLQWCPNFCDPIDCSLPGSSVHGVSPGKNTRVGCNAILQDLPNPGIKPKSPTL